MGERMKGQFFLLSSLIVATLFFAYLPDKGFLAPDTSQLSSVSGNIEGELYRALNLGLAEANPSGTLSSFSSYVKGVLEGRGVRTGIFWAFSRRVSQSDVDIYLGNFMGQDLSVSVTLDGETITNNVQDGSSAVFSFYSVPEEYSLILSYAGQQKTAKWQRDKVNIIGSVVVEQGLSRVVRDVEG